jgi:hypothetical protein
VVFSFFKIMYSFRVRQGDGDKIWSPSKRSEFEVKSYYLTSSTRSPFGEEY